MVPMEKNPVKSITQYIRNPKACSGKDHREENSGKVWNNSIKIWKSNVFAPIRFSAKENEKKIIKI